MYGKLYAYYKHCEKVPTLGNSLLIYIDVSIRIVMNQKQIEKDMTKAQTELKEVVGAVYVYLTSNGMKSEFVKKLISDEAQHTMNQIEELRN